MSVFLYIGIFVNVHIDFTNLNPQFIFLRVRLLRHYRGRGRYCICAAALFSAPDCPPQAVIPPRTDCGRGIGVKSSLVLISGG